MDIASQLGQLETSGLVRIAQLHPELEYIFRHALVQDAVYESLLRQDRRRLHRMVAETLERAYPDRVEEMAAMLGTHFALAEDSERALHYCIIAARSAERRYANAEAITHYSAALELVRQTNNTESLHEISLGLSHALRLTGQFEQAVHIYEQMQAHAHSENDLPMLLDALLEQATVYATSTPVHDSQRALALCDQALELARQLDQPAIEAKILWNKLLAYKFDGRGRLGLPYGEQALEIARTTGDATLIAYILNDLGSQGYLDTAQFRRAAVMLQEAGSYWRELNNPHMLTDSLASLSIMRWLLGESEEALRLTREAWRIAESVGNQWGKAHSLWTVPFIYSDQGRYEDALIAAETGFQLAEASGFIAGMLGMGSNLIFTCAQIGQIEYGLKVGAKCQQVVQAHLPAWSAWMDASIGLLMMEAGDPQMYESQMALFDDYTPKFDGSRIAVGEMFIAMAKLHYALISQRPDEALRLADDVITGMTKVEMQANITSMMLFKGRALAAMGHDHEAREMLETTRQQCEADGGRRVLWQALAALADLADQHGNAAEATELRQQSAAVLTEIAQRIKNPDFRASFLAQPQVSAILERVQ